MANLHLIDPSAGVPHIIDAGGGDGNPPMELSARVAKLEAVIPTLATKEDLWGLRTQMAESFGKNHAERGGEFGKVRAETAGEFGKVRVEMAGEFGKVRAEMAEGFGKFRAEMAEGFGKSRSEMLKEVGDLRSEMHKEFSLQTWRIITYVTGLFVTVGSALVGATYFIAKHL